MTLPHIAIASDHAGFEQKELLSAWLSDQGFVVVDYGPFDDGRVDYPDFASLVARAVGSGQAELGVLVCGTGIGMAIAANKIAGVRAANLTSVEFAQLAREHNAANVATLSGRFIDVEENKQILSAWLNATPEGGRHAERVAKIDALLIVTVVTGE